MVILRGMTLSVCSLLSLHTTSLLLLFCLPLSRQQGCRTACLYNHVYTQDTQTHTRTQKYMCAPCMQFKIHQKYWLLANEVNWSLSCKLKFLSRRSFVPWLLQLHLEMMDLQWTCRAKQTCLRGMHYSMMFHSLMHSTEAFMTALIRLYVTYKNETTALNAFNIIYILSQFKLSKYIILCFTKNMYYISVW